MACHLAQQLTELPKARLDARPDVENVVGRIGRSGQEVGPCNVARVDEVHRLCAVAEDQRGFATAQPLQPPDHDLGVDEVLGTAETYKANFQGGWSGRLRTSRIAGMDF